MEIPNTWHKVKFASTTLYRRHSGRRPGIQKKLFLKKRYYFNAEDAKDAEEI
jgi:hypothetical protein